MGRIVAATSIRSQATTAYATAILTILRRFNSAHTEGMSPLPLALASPDSNRIGYGDGQNCSET